MNLPLTAPPPLWRNDRPPPPPPPSPPFLRPPPPPTVTAARPYFLRLSFGAESRYISSIKEGRGPRHKERLESLVSFSTIHKRLAVGRLI